MKRQPKTSIRKLHDLGQCIWLDNIAREIPNNGTLARCIAELSVTALTSNPAILEHAIGSGGFHDAAMQKPAAQGRQARRRLEPRRVKAHCLLPLAHRLSFVKDLLQFKTPLDATQRTQVIDRQAASPRCLSGAAAPTSSSLIAVPTLPAPSRLSLRPKSCRCSRCSRAARRTSRWWPSSMRRFPCACTLNSMIPKDLYVRFLDP